MAQDDYREYSIGARIDNLHSPIDEFKDSDPFIKSWDELKNLSGLDNNFKRRAARMSKALVDTTQQGYIDSAIAVPQGVDGAHSNQINPGNVFRNG